MLLSVLIHERVNGVCGLLSVAAAFGVGCCCLLLTAVCCCVLSSDCCCLRLLLCPCMPLSVASTCVLLLFSVFTSVCGVMNCLLLSSVQWHESSIGNTIASIALSDVGLLFAGSTNGLMFAIGAYTPYGCPAAAGWWGW